MNRAALLSELETKYFWWEPVGTEPRSSARIIAQAMDIASFEDMCRLERELGHDVLLDTMLAAQPGWLNERSWAFWRGRLASAAGPAIPRKRLGDRSMPERFDAKIEILPAAQQELWPLLAPAPRLSFVLYGGTAIALHLGHRISVDFDFFRTKPLNKAELLASFAFLKDAKTIQEATDTLVVQVVMPSGNVKVSFFGGITFGRINEPLLTADSTLLVASREDLMSTKLKAILDRAEAKDYRDISALLANGASLENGLGAFTAMFKTDPALPLKAIGFFKDGDLPTLPTEDKDRLRKARDKVTNVPKVLISDLSLTTQVT